MDFFTSNSLTLKNEDRIISTLPIDFSFNRLEYLILDLVQPKLLHSLLPKLKFSANEYRSPVMSISLPMVTNNQISPIEHLSIDHPFTFTELSSIISYTSQFHRLNLRNESIIK